MSVEIYEPCDKNAVAVAAVVEWLRHESSLVPCGLLRAKKPPGLELFASADSKHVLVEYDEKPERKKQTQRRAYWLNTDEKPWRNPHKPVFVLPGATNGLRRIEVYPTDSTNAPCATGLCAISSPDDIAFTLFSEGRPLSTHRLPVYPDPVDRARRIAVTPLAVLCDLTIIGGFIFLEAWAQGDLCDFH